MALGFIYSISTPHSKYCYIGSTNDIKRRWGHHQDDFRRYLLNKPICKNGRKMNYKHSFELLKYGDCVIQEVDRMEYNDKSELRELESFYIDIIPDVINSKKK